MEQHDPSKTRILVVDDDAAFGAILQAALELHGFAVRYEERSTRALRACVEFRPDLVLLDVDMPIKDGGQVAAELKQHPTLGRTPVVFLTSLVTRSEAKHNHSTRTVLSKPVPTAELVATIRAALQASPSLESI